MTHVDTTRPHSRLHCCKNGCQHRIMLDVANNSTALLFCFVRSFVRYRATFLIKYFSFAAEHRFLQTRSKALEIIEKKSPNKANIKTSRREKVDLVRIKRRCVFQRTFINSPFQFNDFYYNTI